ncbi:MAG: GPW/gp25 family protein [Croceibacterium sp.]
MEHYDHLAYPLAVDRGIGTFAEEGDYSDYIRSLILQVLMTAQGERINRPEFGASLRRLVFAPLGANIETWVQTLVLQALDRWLARYVRVERVTVIVADTAIRIDVDYAVLAQGEMQFLTMEVTA